MQQENEHNARDHVVKHGVRRYVYQIAAVVDALDADAGRQDAALVDLVHFGFDALDRRHALGAAAHEDDALNDVVCVVESRDAETGQVADGHRGHIADDDRGALVVGDQCVANLIRRMNEPDAAYHRGLGAEIDRLAADVDVRVAESRQHLRHG